MPNIMSSLNHKTFQLKEKMGSSNTSNPDFINVKTRIENAQKKLQQIQQLVQKVVDNYKAIQVLQNEVSASFLALYNNGPIQGAMKSYEEGVIRLGELQATFAEQVRMNLQDPLLKYLEIFKDAKKRADELNNRRIDMDRYNERRLKMAEKQNASKEKLPEYDAKYRHAKDLYEVLLEELMNDLTALNDDVTTFVSPLFAGFAKYHAEFLLETSRIFNSIPPMCSQINIEAIHSHQSVVTPLEFSAMLNKNVAPRAAVEPTSTYQQTTTYQQTPSYQPSAPPSGSKPLPPRPGGGLRAKALFDFTASDSTELSFSAGNVLTIKSRDGDWWDAELNGRRGQIPANYVEMM